MPSGAAKPVANRWNGANGSMTQTHRRARALPLLSVDSFTPICLVATATIRHDDVDDDRIFQQRDSIQSAPASTSEGCRCLARTRGSLRTAHRRVVPALRLGYSHDRRLCPGRLQRRCGFDGILRAEENVRGVSSMALDGDSPQSDRLSSTIEASAQSPGRINRRRHVSGCGRRLSGSGR